MKKYSEGFERDFKWYLKIRNIYNFDGKYSLKKPNNEIIYDKNGVDGKYAFYNIDTNGKYLKTKHPNIVNMLLIVKGSVNLHIKMYAEDRANGILPLINFNELCEEYKVPDWFIKSVEKQKYKYYGKRI